jgi:hypothetical protein
MKEPRGKNKPKATPYKRVERVDVYIWGKFVGAAALDSNLGFYVFASLAPNSLAN